LQLAIDLIFIIDFINLTPPCQLAINESLVPCRTSHSPRQLNASIRALQALPATIKINRIHSTLIALVASGETPVDAFLRFDMRWTAAAPDYPP
jgi:hypothetical protein